MRNTVDVDGEDAGDAENEMVATPAPKIAPKSSLLTAKYAGKCACGARVAAGEQIAYSRRYDWPIVGCAACAFGTFEGLNADALLVEARSYMALANNAANMRARDGSVGRLLTRNELAVAAMRAPR